MAGLLQGDGPQMVNELQEKLEEPDHSSSNWYFSREFIEKNSPSRKDGIDLKKETYLRKSYCTFVQDLGMRLKVPQVTIATAIVFCHRFFLRQSHAKNDRFMIATVCMFLAGKVEETPKLLQTVIQLSYEIRHKKDPSAVQRIKQKDVYEREKELVLLGERLVLTTLGFDLNIHHPYKPLVSAIKKFKVAQSALAQVAWNFINDGLRTSLCLQFKPHHVAAGAIFLAAKFLKVKLPSDGEKLWWQEFDVTPRQLEEVSNQMLELYEQNRGLPGSRSSDPGAASTGMNMHSSAGNQNDKTVTSEAPPGTPQVEERRSAAEAKHDLRKASLVGLEEVNIDKVKEKRRKHRLEGGDKFARTKLSDEEELLEREMENGHKDGNKYSSSYPANDYQPSSRLEGRDTTFSSKHETDGGTFIEGDIEADLWLGSADGKFRQAYNRDHQYHHAQNQRKVEVDLDHHRQKERQKERDWQERDHKRPRYEHVK